LPKPGPFRNLFRAGLFFLGGSTLRESLENHFRRTEMRERALDEIHPDKNAQPKPGGIDVSAKDEGKQHHGAGKDTDFVFEGHNVPEV
jgi:hypothetical protein